MDSGKKMDSEKKQPVEALFTNQAPTPAGHYVQATRHDRIVYVSGQLPVCADGTHAPEASFEDQAKQALDNLLAVLWASGSSPERLLKVSVYIVGVKNWPAFNAAYAKVLGPVKPARTVVPVPELHYGYLVEIDAVAAVNPA